MTEHLYIHIPFCSNICLYCDFPRLKTNNQDLIKKYLDKLIFNLKSTSIKNQYKTIYIGGGTPNYLNEIDLDYLLSNLKEYLNENEYEFTIELNPELVTEEQVIVLAKNKINRISIGVQTFNTNILKKMNRNHDKDNVINAINFLIKSNIKNISLDFIYGFNDLKNKDLDESFNFISKYGIKHVSFYALEVKTNSILNKQKYRISEELIEDQLMYIQDNLKELKYQRYEVSNWTTNLKYQSQHNKAYWLSNDWKAIGYGSSGFENRNVYENSKNFDSEYLTFEKISVKDYYFQILMMGLRLNSGIDLNIEKNKKAYEMYEKKITNCQIKNNMLFCNNPNLLNDILINLLD